MGGWGWGEGYSIFDGSQVLCGTVELSGVANGRMGEHCLEGAELTWSQHKAERALGWGYSWGWGGQDCGEKGITRPRVVCRLRSKPRQPLAPRSR